MPWNAVNRTQPSALCAAASAPVSAGEAASRAAGPLAVVPFSQVTIGRTDPIAHRAGFCLGAAAPERRGRSVRLAFDRVIAVDGSMGGADLLLAERGRGRRGMGRHGNRAGGKSEQGGGGGENVRAHVYYPAKENARIGTRSD